MERSFAFLPASSVSLREKRQFCCQEEISVVSLLVEEMYLNQQTSLSLLGKLCHVTLNIATTRGYQEGPPAISHLKEILRAD